MLEHKDDKTYELWSLLPIYTNFSMIIATISKMSHWKVNNSMQSSHKVINNMNFIKVKNIKDHALHCSIKVPWTVVHTSVKDVHV
jgi:hypothetical protein